MADKYIISGTKLTAIADAIRAKTGGTDTLTADQMAAAIKDISDAAGAWCKKALNGTMSGDTTIPDDVTSLPDGLWQNNETITSINFNKIAKIPDWLIQNPNQRSELTSVTFTDSQTYIGSNAFEGTKLTSLSFPAKIEVGGSAFYDCYSLDSVTFNGESTIHSAVFRCDESEAKSDFTITFKAKTDLYGDSIFDGRSGRIVFQTGDSVVSDEGVLYGYKGRIYVPRSYLTAYKEKDSLSSHADIIYAIPKYITYTAPDGTYVAVNDDDGTQTASPLSSTHDDTALSFVNPNYDTVKKTVDLSGVDYFEAYDIGAITMTQTAPVVTITIPDGATAAVMYDGATISQAATQATYRIASGTSVSYTVNKAGYRPYSGSVTTTGSQSITVTESEMTAYVVKAVDYVTPFSDTSEMGSLVDGTNFIIKDGYITNGSASYNVDNGSSFGYLTISTPYNGTTLDITYKVSSESCDIGYIIVTDDKSQCEAYSKSYAVDDESTTTPTTWETGKKYLIGKMSRSSNDYETVSVSLPASKTIYVGFGYIKDGSDNIGDDRIYIKEIKYSTMA